MKMNDYIRDYKPLLMEERDIEKWNYDQICIKSWLLKAQVDETSDNMHL